MYENDNRDVAIYARVSTEHEAQMSALENQKDWYETIISQHPNWKIIHMYVDEGITGTSAKKRTQFLKMIEDAKEGKFNLIITREVSRFARNTVDTLQYTRTLKAKGVEVYFINDNIRTFDSDGELRLTIMATLAQDESRKTSIRVKSGQQISMQNGVVYGNGNILGYDRKGKEFIINPEQAKTVRMIFDFYLGGTGIRKIQFELEKHGRLTATGKDRWHCSCISRILKNSFYCGIMTYHKEYVPDYLEQKKVRNFGEIQMIQVQGTHTPIVTVEEYNKAQQMMNNKSSSINNRGRKTGGIKKSLDLWCNLLICECGHKFNRKIWHKNSDGSILYGYQCYSSIRSGTTKTRQKKGLSTENVCTSPMISDWKLNMMAKYIFNEYITNVDKVLSLANSILSKHIVDKPTLIDNSESINKVKAEIDKLIKRKTSLIDMCADGLISRAEFDEHKQTIDLNVEQLNKNLEELSQQTPDNAVEDTNYEHKITVLNQTLKQYTTVPTEGKMPEEVIAAFVEKIVVNKDGFDWYLRFDPNNPHTCNITGSRRGNGNNIVISEPNSPSFANSNTGSYTRKEELSSFVKVGEFKITLDYARLYLRSKSNKNRIHRWNDIILSIYI